MAPRGGRRLAHSLGRFPSASPHSCGSRAAGAGTGRLRGAGGAQCRPDLLTPDQVPRLPFSEGACPQAPPLRPGVPRRRPEGGSGRQVPGRAVPRVRARGFPRATPIAGASLRQGAPAGPRSAHRGGRAGTLPPARPRSAPRARPGGWTPEPASRSLAVRPRRARRGGDPEFLERDHLAKRPGERPRTRGRQGWWFPAPRPAPTARGMARGPALPLLCAPAVWAAAALLLLAPRTAGRTARRGSGLEPVPSAPGPARRRVLSTRRSGPAECFQRPGGAAGSPSPGFQGSRVGTRPGPGPQTWPELPRTDSASSPRSSRRPGGRAPHPAARLSGASTSLLLAPSPPPPPEVAEAACPGLGVGGPWVVFGPPSGLTPGSGRRRTAGGTGRLPVALS